MTIRLNNEKTRLPEEGMTVADLLEWKGIRINGTAVAVNGSLASRDKWNVTKLSDNDDVVVISAAFGG